jgi:hypothetical protein
LELLGAIACGCVGKDWIEECNVTENEEEIDSEGFITVRTKGATQANKHTMKANNIESNNSKSVS